MAFPIPMLEPVMTATCPSRRSSMVPSLVLQHFAKCLGIPNAYAMSPADRLARTPEPSSVARMSAMFQASSPARWCVPSREMQPQQRLIHADLVRQGVHERKEGLDVEVARAEGIGNPFSLTL